MSTEQEITEHEEFIANLTDHEKASHSSICEYCKMNSFFQASIQAVSYNFPELQGGTEKQRGWVDLIRVKCYEKHGNAIDPLITVHTDPEWWIANRKTLSTGGLKGTLGKLIRRATLTLENPTMAQLEVLTEALTVMKKDHKKEIKIMETVLNNTRSEFAMQEAEIELVINEFEINHE